MKLQDLFEAKHFGPAPTKEPKLPEILRTKKGMEDFMAKWKKDMWETMWEVWGNFDKTSFTDFEDAWYNFEASLQDATFDLWDTVPESMKEVFQTFYSQLEDNMITDAREDFVYAEHE